MGSAPSRLVLAYVGTAHLALLAASCVALVSAPALTASYLHPHSLATAHLVTLGWLTATALGAIYAVLPMALRTPLPARWPDVVACIAVLLGASGVIAHMALGSYSGVTWSGATIAAGAACVAARAVPALARGRAPRLTKVTVTLALSALVLAAVLGMLVAIDRSAPLFPGGHLRALAAHAHLALVGWLGLLLVGVGHRLLPMLIPASQMAGARPWVAVACLATGAFALPATWLATPARMGPAIAALPLCAGIAAFARDVAWLRRQRKPRAQGLPHRDPALLVIGFAILCFVAAAGLGMALLLCDLAPALATLYGVLLVIGGFGGIVFGVGLRIWPMFAWLRVFARTASVPDVAAGALPSYPLQWLGVLAWLVAVPCMGAGVALGEVVATRVGAAAWLLAALAACANLGIVLRRARRAPRLRVARAAT